MDRFLELCLKDGQIKELYKLAFDVSTILDKHKIVHWADGGTLLSIVRHEGLQMAHDDNVDIGVFDKDYEMVKELVKSLFKYKCDDEKGMIKVYIPNSGSRTEFRTIDTPSLYIWNYISNKKIIYLKDESQFLKFTGAKHKCKDFYPLIEKKYGLGNLMCPKEPLGYLNKSYPNWKTTLEIRYNNRYGVECNNSFDINQLREEMVKNMNLQTKKIKTNNAEENIE